MILTSRMYVVSLAFRLIPETQCFNLKRRLLFWAGVNVAAGVRICSSATILGSGSLSIGQNTWVGHESLIVSACSISIGRDVDIAPRVYIGTGTHKVDAANPRSAGTGVSKPVRIGDGAWLGAGCIILPGVNIGYKAVVAAGAVVAQNVEPYTMVGGVPAKLIKALK